MKSVKTYKNLINNDLEKTIEPNQISKSLCKKIDSVYIKELETPYLNLSQPYLDTNLKLFPKLDKSKFIVDRDFYHHIGRQFLTEVNQEKSKVPIQITNKVKENYDHKFQSIAKSKINISKRKKLFAK